VAKTCHRYVRQAVAQVGSAGDSAQIKVLPEYADYSDNVAML